VNIISFAFAGPTRRIKRKAVDRGNDWLFQPLYLVNDALSRGRVSLCLHWVDVDHVRNVGACAERALAGAGNDYNLD
jgi:hypothetical protein